MKHNFPTWILGVYVISVFVAQHIEGSRLVEPLWEKFVTVAEKGTYEKKIIPLNAGLDCYHSLDYQGKLDSIVAERNRILKQNGFMLIGKWVVTGSAEGVTATGGCLYIKNPFTGW